MFIWSEKDLNKEQSKAVIEEKSVMLIACPGSGKTRTLTYKIAYELSRLDNEKQFLVALTYTNVAADEIKERIELLGVDTTQLWIGTIHAFCLEWILRPYSLYQRTLKKGFTVINSFDTEEIITDLCSKYNEENNIQGRNKVTYWDCGYFATTKGFVKPSAGAKILHVEEIFKRYFKILQDNNQIDFEQILHYSFQLLVNKPIICSILSKLFPYLIVDEYQDTKEIQYNIISLILKEANIKTKLFIVGDPNQGIYETMGGYPIIKEDLETLAGIKLKQLELISNYRSSEKIIKYFDFFKSVDNRIIAKGKDQLFESNITFNYKVKEAVLVDEIARLIRYNVEECGIKTNEICVLAPQWVYLAGITRNLVAKLPDYSFDGPGMAPFSRDVENFWYKLSRIILTEPSPYMYIRRLRWSSEILNDLFNAGVDISNFNNKAFLRLCNSIIINENEGLKYLEKFFNEVCKRLNINLSDFRGLEDHYSTFFASSERRIERLKKDGNDFIDTIETFKKVFKQRDGIVVTTFHGVKGAEYDTVIAFALLEDLIPHFSDIKKNRAEAELHAKKLLYVISSRARKNLHLISEANRPRRFGSYGITNHLKTYNHKYD